MNPPTETHQQLRDEVANLRARLAEDSDILRAIRSGEVDAVLAQGPRGDQLFTLKGADDPYRVLIEEMNQGAVTLSADGSILYCNHQFGILLKTPLEQIVGLAFDTFVAPSERPAFAALLEAARIGNSAGEITLQDCGGRTVPLQLALGRLPAESAAAICLVATDISESREKEARLHQTMTELVETEKEAEAARAEAERANRAKSEFLANMSHEIRTPMNGIIGMTDLALDTTLTEEQRGYLGMAKTSGHALLGLINDILDFSKIEAGKLELEAIEFSLRDSVGEMLQPLAIRAQQKGLKVAADIRSDVPDRLIGDPLRLRQILINLTDNAIKFTARGAIVLRVDAGAEGEGGINLHFSVADTGIGIPAEKQHAIFEAFAQADGSTTRTYGGTGLGLAIASRLVEQMRGKIWIESTGGKGTTFHFTARFGLAGPSRVQPDPGEASRPLEVSPGETAGLRILLAEDNVINRALATGILEKRGHSLVHAVNGREAVEAAARESFDLIFMDVQMPEMDGFEATRRIREAEQTTGRHTPISAMTAHALAGDRERCLAAGMDDYISKPLEKTELFALLARIDRGPRGRPGHGRLENGRDRTVGALVPEVPPPAPPEHVPLAAPAPAPTVSPRPRVGRVPHAPEAHPSAAFNVPGCLRITRAASWFAIVVGLAVLLGWVCDFRPLMTVLPGFVSMKPNTAIALCCSGLSLLLFAWPVAEGRRRSRKLSTALAGTATILGALTLWEYATASNLGIDELLFPDFAPSRAPGRMAPLTAFNFVCLGLALVGLHFPKRTALVHALTGCAALTALLAIVGYFFGVSMLYQSGHFTAVALHTALAFLALCIGVWCATSRYGFMLVITDPGTCGTLIRRYGWVALLLPLVFAWLRLHGEHSGWYGTEFGVAVLAMLNVITFATLIWIGGRSLRAAERSQAMVQESLLEAHVELEDRVLDRTRDLAAANVGLQVQMTKRALAEHANQQIMDHSLDVICTFDAGGRFLQVSRASEALWGYRPEELVGRSFLELVHPEDLEKTVAVDQSILSGEPKTDFENRYVRKDGSVVTILWTAQWSEEHQINFCVARDITGRKQMEGELVRAKEAAEASNRAKSEFLANMSHEIRTPMNGIIGMTELVLETDLDRVQREYLGMAQSSAHALLGLLNDILDFSKIEAGKLELEAISFSLRAAIGMMLKPLGMRANQKGLELTADILAEVPDHLIGDPLRLRQILINLIDNAIKFTERGDVMLRVAVESETATAHCLHFSIADTGIGIPAAKQAQIFEAFAQADGTTTRTHGGTGLGLAICTQLVGQMGGRIWVESTPGEGTTFHFTAHFGVEPGTCLPGEAGLIASRSDPAAKSPNPDSILHILLAEDNAINRALAAGILEKRGHSLVYAANGREAVEAAPRETFDLIFMDVQMPEMDGFEATRRIRGAEQTTGRHTSIAAMTAHAMTGDRERCLAAGMDDYLSKPLQKAELLALLERVRNAGFQPAAQRSGEPAACPPTHPIFSREKLLDELDGDEELMSRLIALFHENTPRLLDDIRGSIARRSSGDLARSAHALLSSLGAFGAHDAHHLTRQLETQANHDDYEYTDRTFADLERGTVAIHAALAAFTPARA